MNKETRNRIYSISAGLLLIGSSLWFLPLTGKFMTAPPPKTFKNSVHSYLTTMARLTPGEPMPALTQFAIPLVKNRYLRYVVPILFTFLVLIGEWRLKDRLLAVSLYSFTAIFVLSFIVLILFSLMMPFVQIIF